MQCKASIWFILFVTIVTPKNPQLYALSFTLPSSLSLTTAVGHYTLGGNAVDGILSVGDITSRDTFQYPIRTRAKRRKNALLLLQATLNDSSSSSDDDDDTHIQQNNKETITQQNPIRKQTNNNSTLSNVILILTPFLIATLSYTLFPTTFSFFSSILSSIILSTQNQIQIQATTTTTLITTTPQPMDITISSVMGVIMAVLSILYGNIISSTAMVLRQRRLTIHESLNVEADQIRCFVLLLPYLPTTNNQRIQNLLQTYVQYVATYECSPNYFSQHEDLLIGRNEHLLQIRSELHHLSAAGENDDNNNSMMIHPNILEQAYNTIDTLSTHRLQRITALQSTYSPIHWMNIVFLSMVITFVFLLEVYDLVGIGGTDGFDVVVEEKGVLFLELRLVFSMLMGIFTTLFSIGYDLANPFIGSYQV